MDWRCWIAKKAVAVGGVKPTAPAVIKKVVVAKAAPAVVKPAAVYSHIKLAVVTCTGAAAVAGAVVAPVVVEHIVAAPPATQHALREEPRGPFGGPLYWGRLGSLHRHGGGAANDDPAIAEVLAAADVADNGGAGQSAQQAASAPVPEPGTLFLVGTGLIGTVIWYRKRGAK